MSQNVQLITFGKRESSLERSHHGQDETWSQSPLYRNQAADSTERERFLPPVKLDPGWDSMMESTISKKSSTAQLIDELEKDVPDDRYHIVYLIMILQGIAVLLPWNTFINAKDYFENYKLQSHNVSNGSSGSTTLDDYRTNFMSYIGMASQYPNFLMNIINIFVQCGGNTLGIRILTGIMVMVSMLVVTVVLAMLDTTTWPETFFWITIVTAIVINAAVGIYQNSLYGLAASLPMKYTNAVVFGSNLSGTLVSVTNILLIILSPSQKTSAIYYFVTAIVILLMAFDGYFILRNTKFFRHYMKLSLLKKQEFQESNISNEPFYKILFRSFGRVVRQIYHLIFGVFFTFFITLLLFPAVSSDIRPLVAPYTDSFAVYWTPVFCFLFFNFFATLGNLATVFIQWPNSRWINVLVIIRIIFIPLMILANFRPTQRSLPVLITIDEIYIVSSALFSFSSGYCSSLTMMYAPSCVAPSDAPIAGMIMALSLAFGILIGINCSRIWGFLV
uniref:Equilibrative nucleoside transporter 1 n=1 Tax=Biomphalaria glabrata TaxID=6526 RepID=A0A2C9LT29_BIOGL